LPPGMEEVETEGASAFSAMMGRCTSAITREKRTVTRAGCWSSRRCDFQDAAARGGAEAVRGGCAEGGG
jgi:hypothetical protein